MTLKNYRPGWICGFLFTLTLVNYTDRVALSVSATAITTAREVCCRLAIWD